MSTKFLNQAWTYVAVDPFEELLLGPTFATEKVLRMAGLSLADMGVIEFHEVLKLHIRTHACMFFLPET